MLSLVEAFIGFFSSITISSICGEFSEEADGAAQVLRATKL
jgi:hypothetical protein